MKKIILSLLFSFGLLFGNIGKITGVKGDVLVKRGTQELVPAVGFILEKSDEIITKDKSKVLLLFTDGTSITVGKESKMKVNEYIKDEAIPSNNKAKFGFDKGVFRSITGKIGKVNPSGFKLETKSSSLGIRGSEGISIVKANGDIKHSTLNGGYYIVNKATGQTFEIPRGMTANFVGGKTIVLPTTKADIQEAQDLSGDKTQSIGEKNDQDEPKQDGGTNGDAATNDNGEQGQIATNDEIGNGDNGIPQEQSDMPNLVESETPMKLDTPKINDLAMVPETPKEDINSKPVLTYSLLEINENEISTINFKGIDIDGDNLVYLITSPPLHGTATIDSSTGKLTYIPNQNYDGSETLTVQVSDGKKNGSDTKTLSFVVQNNLIESLQTFTPTGTLESLMVDLANVTKEIVGSDTYENTNIFEYGYILDGSSKTATYITGLTTPSEVIEQYIINQQVATYSGDIASFVNGVASNGTINLNMNFGTKTLTGNIDIEQGNWKANINSGTISSYGFNSSSISSATGSSVTDIAGSLNGKYYGPTASSVGGTLSLTSSKAGTVNGVFGGKK